MFKTILIANRGEIACRIMRTAQRMGVRCVAVHSDADAGSMHVAMAEAAVRIGPPAAALSYLNAAAIIAAGRAAGAEAVHPGYGFLSENAGFAEACTAAGLVFIGPPAAAIRAMGLKDAAKRLMQQAGVPVVPGYHDDGQEPEFLLAQAKRIGFPVLIKAAAGGGGKGMRLAGDAGQFSAALASVLREAAASFGDSRVLIEKYLPMARHVEVQVFADAHGNAVHLFERDCSLQRRHQKVIEEAPAPGMTPVMRAAMGKAAVDAARAVNYRGAGTVEFIADIRDGLRPDRFYFMEMNTRLQVEHPVTEAITGLDLVEWQLRVAAGERLPLSQDQLGMNGHAFEARIYAEDAAHDFRPATGRIDYLRWPANAARIDAGVREGDEVTPFYDPMLAKLIVHAADRASALAMLSRALDNCRIAGCVTNVGFLQRLSRHADVLAGAVATGLIAQHLAQLTSDPPPSPHLAAVAGLAALGLLDPPHGTDPWLALAGWRLWGTAEQQADLLWHEEPIGVRVRFQGKRHFEVTAKTVTLAVDATAFGDAGGHLKIDGEKVVVAVAQAADTISVFIEDGGQATFHLPDLLAGEAETGASSDHIVSPMPGLVKLVTAVAGAKVAKGDPLLVVEAMKTEYTLSAPRDGTIAEVMAATGERVAAGALLLRLAPI